MNKPIHIMASVMRDPNDAQDACVRINILPLPDDHLVHRALYEAARNAIHSKLTELGLTDPTRVELPVGTGKVQ